MSFPWRVVLGVGSVGAVVLGLGARAAVAEDGSGPEALVPDAGFGAAGPEGGSGVTTPAALRELSWILGTWGGRQGWESWAAAGDVYWGFSLTTGSGWEVMRLDVKDGVVRFLGQPGGRAPTAFAAVGAVGAAGALFADPGHDFPTRIRYAPGRRGLTAAIGGDRGWAAKFAWSRVEPAGFAELAARDRAWEAEVAAGGSDAWVAGFDAEGFMNVPGVGKVTAGPAMKERMAPDLDGGVSVRWAPTGGSVAPGGELGFTVGEATWSRGDVVEWRGSYLTVWKRQFDGGWRARFDVGDVLDG